MGDSEDDFERRGRHDKFRRERNDYDNTRQPQQSRGGDWQNRQGRGGNYQNRGGGAWYGNNYNQSQNRQNFNNDYYKRGQNRDFQGSSPPQKRIRRDSDGDEPVGRYNRNMADDGIPAAPAHQPPMKNFKQFITALEDEVDDAEAIAKYQEYKLEFKKTQISEYFVQHKDEEWFQEKYHPEHCEQYKENQRKSYQTRLDAFQKVLPIINQDDLTVDLGKDQMLVRLLDSAVIYMEGGTEKDLQSLDLDDADVANSTKEEKPSGDGDESDDSSSSSSSSDDDSESDEEKEKPKKKKKSKKVDEKKGEEGEIDRKPEVTKPRPLHKTVSLFIKALPPKITRKELEEVLKQTSPGFLRLAFTEALPERKFFRRGYATFKHDVNIKEICWHLNNQKVQDQELETMVNKSIQLRVRPVNGVTSYKDVVRADLRNAAKLVQKLDQERGLYVDEKDKPPPVSAAPAPNAEAPPEDADAPPKEDTEVDATKPETETPPTEPKPAPTVVAPVVPNPPDLTKSKNPLLDNITDHLIEEVSAEEEEVLGLSQNVNSDELNLDRDEKLLKVLDRLILYLRIVHSVDYYSATEYPGEDDMPSRVSMMHARGVVQGNVVKLAEVKEYIGTFENKLTKLFASCAPLSEPEVIKLGKKEESPEIEKFIEANTKDLGDDKYLCPLSGKKFKGPDFVRKHIFNKHGEKLENVKKEVAFFNNYLADPNRPSLPEAPKQSRYDSRADNRGDYSSSFNQGGGFQNRNSGGWNQGGGFRQGGYNSNFHSQNYRGGNRRMGGGGFGGRGGGFV